MRGIEYSAPYWSQIRGCLLIDVWNVLQCHWGCGYNTQHWTLPLETTTSKDTCTLLHFTNQAGARDHRFCNPFKEILSLRKWKQKIGVEKVTFPIVAVLSHQILKAFCGITSSLPAFIPPNKFRDALSFTRYSLLGWLKTLKSSTVPWIKVHLVCKQSCFSFPVDGLHLLFGRVQNEDYPKCSECTLQLWLYSTPSVTLWKHKGLSEILDVESCWQSVLWFNLEDAQTIPCYRCLPGS